MKKEIKKFTKIINYKKINDDNEIFNKNCKISITEKIDGANASFIKDDDDIEGISCFSRNCKLTNEDGLNGFKKWVEINIKPIKEKLNPNYRYIGEWLVRHKVKYKEDKYKNFYLFAIMDDNTEKYLSDEIVKKEAERLGLNTVDFFYEGNFIDIKHLEQFIGKSNITEKENNGEGIVVKWLDLENQIFLKLISEDFIEMKIPSISKKNLLKDKQKEIINNLTSYNRIEKNILKMIDENLITCKELSFQNFGNIIKKIVDFNISDIIEEDNDILKDIDIDNKVLIKNLGKNITINIRKFIETKEKGE